LRETCWKNRIWEVEVRVRVDGTVVLDQELLNILKSISSNKTLTHTSINIGLSYPKVKKKIELAEKALRVRLVDVGKGGGHKRKDYTDSLKPRGS